MKTGTVGLSHCGDGVSGAVSGGRGGRGPRLAGVSIVERLIKIVECTSEGPWTRVAAIKVLTQAQILKSTPYIDFYISKYTRALTFESRTHSLTRVSGCCCPCHRARADGAGGLPGYAPDPRRRFVCGQPHARGSLDRFTCVCAHVGSRRRMPCCADLGLSSRLARGGSGLAPSAPGPDLGGTPGHHFCADTFASATCSA